MRDLRGFIGLANQLGMFIPDLAHMTSPLRPLMKRDVAWLWLQEHEEAFMKTKELLTSTSLVKPFDETKETLMLTYASRLYGLGFALIQISQDVNNISLMWLVGLPAFIVLTDHRPLVGISENNYMN